MNLFEKTLLLLITCAGVTGPAQAIEQPRSPGTPRPAAAAMGAPLSPGAGTVGLQPGPDWLIDGVPSELLVAFSAGGVSARTTEKAGTGPREGLSAAQAAVPEPSEWMQLVCGLAFVAFVARRRTRPTAG